MTSPHHTHGFSLIEVAMAVGIFSFVAVALIGLFSLGFQTSRESMEELDATNLVQSMFAARKAAPMVKDLRGCAIPALSAASANSTAEPLFVNVTGNPCSRADARFGMLYSVSTPSATHRDTRLYVLLYWPPVADPTQARGSYEAVTSLVLP